MRLKEKVGRAQATLNLTPTIDVVFLLLIFFIATIRLPEPEANIRAYLPRKEKAASAGRGGSEEKETENVTRIRIALRTVGGARTELRLNGALLEGGFRTLDRRLRVMRVVAEKTPTVKTEVILDAARTVPYRFVVTALDICTKHGFSTVSFAMPRKGAATRERGML